ncbi:hypothetical protein C482_12704 [Natrialba chahannaoensis JCM 10990]|uniref:Uncharacterized protein n=1 Tax=Natrialba chahannaoensis JCM 10990 TaxID=1227492 RepID=M0AG26_9EURY|nr:hypothetical protein [Natrialba chahannaoensis]ELY97484.1 hypothetical protein C482_12704 [Natrialba chahannaoensis JCM 10990]
MTSIRNQLESAVGVGKRFRVTLEERDGEFVAAHPLESSPLPIVVSREEISAETLPAESEADTVPVEAEVVVEITDRVRDGRVIGRVVESDCGGVESDADSNPDPNSSTTQNE